MRLLVAGLLVLIITVMVVLIARQDSGHILIAYQDWTLESSLIVFILGLLLLFLAFYYTLRFWSGLRSLPLRLKQWRHRRRDMKVKLSYQRGMRALSEGMWANAEKWLIKEVRHSDAPALHYLAAAKAADAQGSKVRRDSYLRAAAEHDPKAGVAVGLAQAAYHLANHLPEEARSLLGRMHVMQPKHPAILKKLLETCLVLQDWNGLLALIPDLERRHVIHGGKSEELQCQAYRGLFSQAAEKKDAAHLRDLWRHAPRAVQRNENVLFDYACALTNADPAAGSEVTPLLADAIDRSWSESLVYAYGSIASANLPAQLSHGERWLKHHGNNAVLLLTLGRLCLRNQLWGKARSYLEVSLGVEPQAETYRELGNLLEKLNNRNAAMDCYRKALTLVPGKSLTALSSESKRTLLLPLLPAQEET